MSQYKFISYEATPKDQYIVGIATVLAFDKIILRYKHSKTKDGTGDFFVPASYGIIDETGQKRYVNCFDMDSNLEKEHVIALIRKGVAQASKAPKSTSPEMMYAPHGMTPPQPMPQLTPQMSFSDIGISETSDNVPF